MLDSAVTVAETAAPSHGRTSARSVAIHRERQRTRDAAARKRCFLASGSAPEIVITPIGSMLQRQRGARGQGPSMYKCPPWPGFTGAWVKKGPQFFIYPRLYVTGRESAFLVKSREDLSICTVLQQPKLLLPPSVRTLALRLRRVILRSKMLRVVLITAFAAGTSAQTPALGSNLVLLPCSGGFTQSCESRIVCSSFSFPIDATSWFSADDLPNSSFPFLEGKIVVRGWEVPPPGDEILLWCIADTPQLGATMHLWGNSSTDFTPQLWSWNATSQLVRSTAPGQTDWCVGAPPVPVRAAALCDPGSPTQLSLSTPAFR